MKDDTLRKDQNLICDLLREIFNKKAGFQCSFCVQTNWHKEIDFGACGFPSNPKIIHIECLNYEDECRLHFQCNSGGDIIMDMEYNTAKDYVLQFSKIIPLSFLFCSWVVNLPNLPNLQNYEIEIRSERCIVIESK